MAFDFIALDFETANEKRGSVIQIGLSKFRDSELVFTKCMFVTPPPRLDYFLPRNVEVHGIKKDMVLGAPEWPDILRRILKVSGTFPIVAHNAAFERSVIERASEAYGLPAPDFNYLCTWKLAKHAIPNQVSYGLSKLSAALGLPAFVHHDAGADAEASAALVFEIGRRLGVTSIAEMPRQWTLPRRKALGAEVKPHTPVAPAEAIRVDDAPGRRALPMPTEDFG